MKFKKLLKYVENSFENKPSFLIVMDNDKEYISNGCIFVENTDENVKILIDDFNCENYLKELFGAFGVVDISEIENMRWMFHGCSKLTSFDSDISNSIDTSYMFHGCSKLTSFDSDISNSIDTCCMFYGCSKLTSFDSDISNSTNTRWMFEDCSSLTSFDSDISNSTNTRCMFHGCSKLNLG